MRSIDSSSRNPMNGTSMYPLSRRRVAEFKASPPLMIDNHRRRVRCIESNGSKSEALKYGMRLRDDVILSDNHGRLIGISRQIRAGSSRDVSLCECYVFRQL